MTAEETLAALEMRAQKNPEHRAWIEVGCCADDGLRCHLTVAAYAGPAFDYLHHGAPLSRATALDRIAGVYF